MIIPSVKVWNNEENKRVWTQDKIKNSVKVLKDNEIYRVADVKKFKRNHPVVSHILKNKKYKNTLLQIYFSNSKKYTDLYQVLVDKKDSMNLEYYNDEYVVIHLRTGDDLENRGLNVPNIVKILKELKKYDQQKKVIIITAMHYGHHRSSNRFYRGKVWCYTEKNYKDNLSMIQYFISKLDHQLIDIISNDNIDLDIMHLVFCKNLVYCDSCGNFARCIGEWHNRFYNLEQPSLIIDTNLDIDLNEESNQDSS